MHITDDSIQEFIAICRKEYDHDISTEEARVLAMRLLLFYELISKPLPSERSDGVHPPEGGA